jgi:hypothetical protein
LLFDFRKKSCNAKNGNNFKLEDVLHVVSGECMSEEKKEKIKIVEEKCKTCSICCKRREKK